MAFGYVAVGANQSGSGMDVVLGAESRAAFGTGVQQTFVFVTQGFVELIVFVNIAAQIMLMTGQAIVIRGFGNGHGGTHGAILIPAQSHFVFDNVPVIHVISLRMADQAVDAFFGFLRHIAHRHHFFGSRLVIAANVAAAASFAANFHAVFAFQMRRAGFDQRGPAGPGKTPRDAASAIDFANRNLMRAFGVHFPSVKTVSRKSCRGALEGKMDGINHVIQGVHCFYPAIRMVHGHGFVAFQASFRPFVLTNTSVFEKLDMLVFRITQKRRGIH